MSFSGFSIMLLLVLSVGSLTLYYSHINYCKTRQAKLLWKGLEPKLCKDEDFLTKVFEDKDACCRIMRMEICSSAYRLQGELEENCSAYKDFLPFMRNCLPKTSALDLYEITRTLEDGYPMHCLHVRNPYY